jgi:hypothetical protein
LSSSTGCEKSRIAIHEDNPFYFVYEGKPVLLLGGSDEDNLFNSPGMMLRNLETLKEIGGNYIRCTLSSRDEGNVWPYEQINGLYDLDRFNPRFWNRLDRCLDEAEARDIIVQIEFWATFDFYREVWLRSPFNPKNNRNYTTMDTRLVEEWDYHPARKVQPFFYSVPQLNNDKVLLKYQEAFIHKVLDVSADYPNVAYCLDNETSAPPQWAWYWASFVRDKAGKGVLLTEMWDDHDLTGEQHKATYMHPELFDFFDISQNNWQEGQLHYDRILWLRRLLESEIKRKQPLTNVKVYARLHGGRPNSTKISVDRWWQNIFAGCAGTRFHRPPGGIGLGDKAKLMIKAARIFTDEFDIFSCEPSPALLSGCELGEAFCLANPDRVYAVYFPEGGEVRLTIGNPNSRFRLRWFDPVGPTFSEPLPVADRKSVALRTPTTGQVWLALIDQNEASVAR